MIGAMGPKGMRRGAAWAQGAYLFSMNGDKGEMAKMIDMADSAWEEAGRADRPYRMAGFWHSLADDAEPRLRQYVYDYLKIAGWTTFRRAGRRHHDALERGRGAPRDR